MLVILEIINEISENSPADSLFEWLHWLLGQQYTAAYFTSDELKLMELSLQEDEQLLFTESMTVI